MSHIRTNNYWNAGFSAKSFAGGNYSVDVNNADIPNIVITSSGTNSQGYIAKITACATVSHSLPYILRIDMLTVNK
jgi:hypothetical protein